MRRITHEGRGYVWPASRGCVILPPRLPLSPPSTWLFSLPWLSPSLPPPSLRCFPPMLLHPHPTWSAPIRRLAPRLQRTSKSLNPLGRSRDCERSGFRDLEVRWNYYGGGLVFLITALVIYRCCRRCHLGNP